MLAVAYVGAVGACARQGTPPGGPQDRRPPVVVATSPQALDTLRDLGAPVRFQFNERISERVTGGELSSAVSISPRSGNVRVDKGGRSISVRVDGGFRPGLLYRVTLKPVIADLFENRMTDPFELVFSTGGEAVPTTLAGEMWDRVSGEPVRDAIVLAAGGDDLVHESGTDADGIFAFRYLPAGSFTVTGFEDRNMNREVDSTEVQGSVVAEIAVGDTVFVDLPVLEPDTMPAIVERVDVIDSVTLAVVFDDFLDPAVQASSIEAAIQTEEAPAPNIERIMHEAGYAQHVAAVADSLARLDSLDRERRQEVAEDTAIVADTLQRADTGVVRDTLLPVDTLPLRDSLPPRDSLPLRDSLPPPDTAALPDPLPPTPADTVVVTDPPARPPPTALPQLQGSRAGPTPDGRRVLPGRRIVIVLQEPLIPDVEYTARLDGVTNINGLGGGGGEATFVLEPLPEPAPARDTGTAPDTGAVTDTSAVLDTSAVSDTSATAAPRARARSPVGSKR